MLTDVSSSQHLAALSLTDYHSTGILSYDSSSSVEYLRGWVKGVDRLLSQLLGVCASIGTAAITTNVHDVTPTPTHSASNWLGFALREAKLAVGEWRHTLATAEYWSGSVRWIVAEAKWPAPSGHVWLSTLTNALLGACRESRRHQHQNQIASYREGAASLLRDTLSGGVRRYMTGAGICNGHLLRATSSQGPRVKP